MVTLVDVDGSQSSRQALQYAVRSHLPDSELLLLYVSASGRQSELETGRYLLEDGRRACEVVTRGVQVRTRLEVGDPGEAIAAVAEAENAEMIVIGSHGIEGFPHVERIGEIARRLMADSGRKVIVISPAGSEVTLATTLQCTGGTAL